MSVLPADVLPRSADRSAGLARPDPWLGGLALALILLGLVMVASASISIADRDLGQPFYYLWRQLAYVAVGGVAGLALWCLPLRTWERSGQLLILLSIVLLALLLIPGVGRSVNGSTRWIALGLVNLQPSEGVKLFTIIYLGGYLVRRRAEVQQSISGFLKPMLLLAVLVLLLLLEPDFGAAAVLLGTALGMMWLGGVRLGQFAGLLATVAAGLGVLALSSPYRLARLTAFLNPWSDPFNSGFQLTQALIAFGRGEWLGVGLGASVQKLFYLPEAHTDFMFAVLAEELGLVGVVAVIGLFTALVVRALWIARRAERAAQPFAAFLGYGLGLWIALQAFVNIGVNMGVLPTKGLTLPLMSYGGSSMVVMCMAIALLLRVELELREAEAAQPHGGRA